MSQRLTNDLKREILDDIIAETLGEKREAIKIKREQLAEAVYKASFDEKTLEIIKNVPSDWIRVDECIGLELLDKNGGRDVSYSYKFSEGRCLPMPSAYRYRNIYLSVNRDHEIALQALEIDRMEAAIREYKETLTIAVQGVLQSVSTVNKLLEAAPDWKKYIPEEYLEPKKSLPAVRIEAVNELIEALKLAA